MSTHGTFPQYQLIRRLRATPMSQVYEARRGSESGRFLLEMLDGLVGLPSALAAFERDVGLASSPPHPYVLPVQEMSYLPDGTPVAVSELPEAQTLEQWLAGSPALSQRTAVGLVMALADVLAEMHERGVSHGALTADQVFLVPCQGCAAGLPRLQGFGFGWLRGAADRRADLPDAVAEALRQDRDEVGEAERGADLGALAILARRLLAAAAWGASDPSDEAHAGNRRVAGVLARALRPRATEVFATPLSFALALEAALASPETLVLAAMPALVPAAAGAAVAADDDDELLVPARSPRFAFAATAVAVVALVAGFLAWAPTVSGKTSVAPPEAVAAPLGAAAPLAPAELAPQTRSEDAPVPTPQVEADQAAPTPPAPVLRVRTLPRAKRGVVWSARLGRVVPLDQDVIAANDAASHPDVSGVSGDFSADR